MNNFLTWWQHLPENLSPVLFKIGPLTLRYYGLMYVVAFTIVYFLAVYRITHEPEAPMSKEQAGDLMTVMILGLILGARLGYVIFYNPSYYLNHPLEIFLPFEFSHGIKFTGIAGMSYHGGLIGTLVAALWYCRRAGIAFLKAADLFIPGIPLGYTFGRLGNFINGELYGRITQQAIGMVFPDAPGNFLRHPTQLYEAFFEGIFLFAILWSCRKIRLPKGAMIACYLTGYGMVRFCIEFFREPDAQLGFVFLWFTMGQVLCFFMICGGIGFYYYLSKQKQ
jgi:phosphatidylglycerol:prolipoprotein diacylglycerol transferase